MVTTRSQNRRQVPGREPVKKPAPVARAKPAPTTRPKATKPTAKKAAKTPTTRRNNGVTRSGRPAAGQKTNCRQKHPIVDLQLPEGSLFVYEKEKCNVRKLRSRVKIDQYNLSPAFTILLHGKEEGHVFYKGDPKNIIEDQRALDAPRRCTFDDCSSNRIICQLGFTFEKFEHSLPEPSDMKQMGVFIQGKNHVALYMLLPLDNADGNSSSNEEQQGQQQQQQHEQQQQQHEQQQQQHEQQQQQHEQQQQQHEQQQQQHEQQQQQQHQQQQERQQQQPQQQQGNQQQQQQPKDTSSASLKRKFTLRSVETLSKRVRIVRSAQHNSDDAVHEEQMQETPDNAENHEDSVEHATEEDNESSPDEIPCTPNTKDKDRVNRTSTPVIPSTSKGFRGKPVNFMRTGRLSPIDNRKRDEDEDNESISSMSIFEASMSTNASADYLKTLFHEYLADEIEARRFFALAKVVRDNPPWVTLKKSYPPIAQYYNHLRVIGHALYLYPELPRVPPTLHGLVEKEAAERILQKCIAVWELRPALTKAEERKKLSRFNSLFKKVFPEGDRNLFLKTGYPYPDKDQREKKSGKQLYDCFSAILGKTDGGVETKEKM